jgi:hypothetical protein
MSSVETGDLGLGWYFGWIDERAVDDAHAAAREGEKSTSLRPR